LVFFMLLRNVARDVVMSIGAAPPRGHCRSGIARSSGAGRAACGWGGRRRMVLGFARAPKQGGAPTPPPHTPSLAAAGTDRRPHRPPDQGPPPPLLPAAIVSLGYSRAPEPPSPAKTLAPPHSLLVGLRRANEGSRAATCPILDTASHSYLYIYRRAPRDTTSASRTRASLPH
jgi:hypothetical protein